MANPYTSQSAVNYNSSPPSDDGSETAANEITWAKHKTKLGDPLKALAEGINTAVLAAFGKIAFNNISSISTTYTVLTTDQGKLLACSGTITLTLPAAATAQAPFAIIVSNIGTGIVTIDGNGSETIDGETSITIGSGESRIICTDSSGWRSFGGPILADASALKWESGLKVDPSFLRGYLSGLTLSNNSTDATNDIDIAVGACVDSTNAYWLKLTASITKRLDDTWAVGTNAGGLDTGTKANSTTYHVFLIRRSDTGVVDVLFSTSATAPTMPDDYDQKRRIGAIRTGGAGAILGFEQVGDTFMLESPAEDYDAAPTTTATLTALTVPTGVNVTAKFVAFLGQATSDAIILVTSPLQTDLVPSASAPPGVSLIAPQSTVDSVGELQIVTDTSGQIRHRADTTDATFRIWTHGWIDRRGRDG